MPITNAAKQLYRLAIRAGHGSEDLSAIHEYLARNNDGEWIDQSMPQPVLLPIQQEEEEFPCLHQLMKRTPVMKRVGTSRGAKATPSRADETS
jgi:hypothetical protein